MNDKKLGSYRETKIIPPKMLISPLLVMGRGKHVLL
jgi:hypothetical protein